MFNCELKENSANLVVLGKLHDTISGEYPTDAVTTLDITSRTGAPIAAATAVPLILVSGTSGAGTLYRAQLPAGVPGPRGVYNAVVHVRDSAGNTRDFSGTVTVARG